MAWTVAVWGLCQAWEKIAEGVLQTDESFGRELLNVVVLPNTVAFLMLPMGRRSWALVVWLRAKFLLQACHYFLQGNA